MEQRELKIIEETLKLYSKWGFNKVTMSDIAKTVGISRPTLYAVFPNKKSIFGRYVTSHFEQMEHETEKRLKFAKTQNERLQIIFEVWVISPVSQAIKSKTGRDVIANCETYAPDAVKDMYDRIEKQIFQVLRFETKNIQKAKDIAKTLRFATRMKFNTSFFSLIS